MSSEEQTKEVLTALRQISEREQRIIDSFTERFGFLNDHKKIIFDLITKIKQYRSKPSSETFELLSSTSQKLLDKLNDIVKIFLQVQNEETSFPIVEQLFSRKEELVFEDDITGAMVLEQEKIPETVHKKVSQYIASLQKVLGDAKQQRELSEHLQTISRLLSQNISEQEQLYLREISILESYSKQSLELLEQYEKELDDIVQRIEALTLQERQEIIAPMNVLLKRKSDTVTLFEKKIVGKNLITLEDVKDILRTITRTPEELLKVQSLLLKHSQIIDKTPLPKYGNKTCLDVISRYGLVSIAIAEKRKEDREQQSTLDGLTGLLSKTYFQEVSKRKIVESSKYCTPISLLVIDGDKFKYINDTYGHAVGDEVIRFIASTIRATVKSQDVVGRFGGDEFVVLFPNTTVEHAFVAAQRIRETVQKRSSEFLQRIKIPENSITITGGVATFLSIHSATIREAGTYFDELFRKADQALIDGKEKGRNEMYKDERILKV